MNLKFLMLKVIKMCKYFKISLEATENSYIINDWLFALIYN